MPTSSEPVGPGETPPEVQPRSLALATAAAALLILAGLAAEGQAPAGSLKAFPTAEGFGRFAVGGRGGSICQVTTLADAGPGSLRDCLTRSGPRTVVFRVGGTIVVDSTIEVHSGRLTIAGQTAPGGGIQIRNGDTPNSAVQIVADDVIVRHIRFSAGPTRNRSTNNDALFFAGSRAIFDHVSARWATDENVDVVYRDHPYGDVTVQWALIAEPLNGTVAHPGGHAYCFLAGGHRVSLLHSLLEDCTLRAPAVATRDGFALVNSVIYNWSERALDVYARFGPVAVAALGNLWQMGPSSMTSAANRPARLNMGHRLGGAPQDYSLFASGNRSFATGAGQAALVPVPERSALVAHPPFPVDPASATSAEQAFRDVMAFAGAFPRDAADARIVEEARTCTGHILRNESEIAGGYPVLAGGAPYPDADADGMSDAWEAAHGVSDPNGDADKDGYTNLEEFLNELAGDQDGAGNILNRAGTGRGPVPPLNCNIAVRETGGTDDRRGH